MNKLHLVLGGARSGKSGYAESLASKSEQNVVYIATARALDDEMQQRIQRHQIDRPDNWSIIEEPFDFTSIITKDEHRFILIDCLTLWLMNLIEEDKNISEQSDKLISALEACRTPVVLVSNEITMGVVPMGEMSRTFVDELGRLHQKIAQLSDQVTLMVAGIPHKIK